MTNTLRAALRDGTRELHARAERAGVMRELLRGELALAAYRRLLHNLMAIYEPLEAGLMRHQEHPLLAPLKAADLFRFASLRSDLLALGTEPADAMLSAPTQAYRDRLHDHDMNAPALLAAHAYVRYLGDLNGGQVLARIVRQAYGLSDEGGTSFYAFGSPDEAQARTRGFAAALDALPLDDAMQSALVAEAQCAFELHVEMFEALAAVKS